MNQRFYAQSDAHTDTFYSHRVLNKPVSTFSHISGFLVCDWLGLRLRGRGLLGEVLLVLCQLLTLIDMMNP